MNFTEYTFEQLIALKDKIDYEIDRRNEEARAKAKEEIIESLNHIQKLQDKYGFVISAYNDYDQITGISGFNVEDY